MATVHRFDGHRVFIYVNDHRPEHVHVAKAEKQAAFELNCPDGPVTVRDNFGFTGAQIKRIERELNSVLAHLCNEWERIHGDG